MSRLVLVPMVVLALVDTPARSAPDRVLINDNRTPVGTLADGVLTLHLEIRDGVWHPDGDADPGLVVRAFGEAGKPAAVPGPLIRVPEGTVIHALVHNTLADSTITVRGLSTRGAAGADPDTIQVSPGATREVRFAAGRPGTYYYWGSGGPGGLAERGMQLVSMPVRVR